MLLTLAEHRRAIGLLSRAISALRGVRSLIHRAGKGHSVRARCGQAIEHADALRRELESAGRAEYPRENLVYSVLVAKPSPDSLADALALPGDEIDSD